MTLFQMILVDLDAKDVVQVAWVLAKAVEDAVAKAKVLFEAAGFKPNEGSKYYLHCIGLAQIQIPGEVVIAKAVPPQTIQIAQR